MTKNRSCFDVICEDKYFYVSLTMKVLGIFKFINNLCLLPMYCIYYNFHKIKGPSEERHIISYFLIKQLIKNILISNNDWTILCNCERMFILCRFKSIDCTCCPTIGINLTLPTTFIDHGFDRNDHPFFKA